MQRIIIFVVETRDGLQIDGVCCMFLCVIPAAPRQSVSLWKELEELFVAWISDPWITTASNGKVWDTPAGR